jgi:hypothetical protein
MHTDEISKITKITYQMTTVVSETRRKVIQDLKSQSELPEKFSKSLIDTKKFATYHKLS